LSFLLPLGNQICVKLTAYCIKLVLPSLVLMVDQWTISRLYIAFEEFLDCFRAAMSVSGFFHKIASQRA